MTDEMTTAQGQSPQPTASHATHRRLWLFRMLAIVFGCVVAFVAMEVFVRALLASRPNDIEALRRFNHAKQTVGELKLIHFVRISDNPRLVYEMLPNIEGTFHKAPLRTNSAGFADRERSLEKPARTFRIAVIGDSIAFGWGVPPEARYSDRLEKFLNETATTSTRYEVLNFGIPGYNTVMEAELLRTRVLRYQPDAILIGYCADNDTSLPNFVARPRPLYTLTHSYLWEMLRTRSVASARSALEAGVQYVDPANVPPEYQALVGWDRAAQAMREIADLARERKIPVLFLRDYYYFEPWRTTPSTLPPDPGADADALAKQLGFVVISPFQSLLEFLDRHGLHSFALSVDIENGDAHPNALRHALLAQEIYRTLVEHKLIPDAAERAQRLNEHMRLWDQWIQEALAMARIPEKYRGAASK
ncbi:MAG: hypothetical protein KatS3mg130_1336 [Candidatus Sumerlaea sp.]|nr:SGNH/GDSL hydrolase family protein [Candidatus Sumerlaea chitinivorans]GIX44928.1 MAG: hypothetical protein KatS3mg130_1336 [Candidatus Sumerlaea sp.]